VVPLPPPAETRVRELIDRFTQAAVLVVGDVMLDRFLVGRVTRISPEAPVPIVAFDHEMHRLGGAANVAHNVRTLGGRVYVIGVVGHDESGDALTRAFTHAGMRASLAVDHGRPTTTKVRIVTERNQQVARVDYESDAELAGEIEGVVVRDVERFGEEVGAILVSDYLKGCVTRRVMAAASRVGERRGIPVLVDPKIPHLTYYAGATVITPNHHEAEVATHRRIRTHEEAGVAAREFRARAHCGAVLMTRGDQGMWLLDERAEGYLPAVAREVADVTGAGDTVIATLALSLAAGAALADAAWLANEAAGIVVGKFGPATVTPEELLERAQIPSPKPHLADPES
jgi:D-beta-D-heptose 7-phosphate kinase/D-beta-D-heptose 1-phosphate adenosyltransferase